MFVMLLSGCASTRFAPPFVSVDRAMSNTQTSGTACAYGIALFKPGNPIQPDLEGAQQIISNYLRIYRCAADDTANGRSFFQATSLVGVGGAAIAMALGAGPVVGIAAGGGSALLTSGNGYFAPAAKAAVYVKAIDAIACIQRESLDTAAYAAPKDINKANETRDSGTGGYPWSLQYFALVKTSLVDVENIARQRVMNVGSFNPTSLVEEVKAAEARIKAAKEDKNPPGANQPDVGEGKKETVDGKGFEAVQVGTGGTVTQEAASKLLSLQPRLEECVIRAKA